MCKCDTNFFLNMPSPRKRIGFLPSEEVHEIIEKLCTANEFSQSKVTGLLVEEALRSRGVLNESYGQNLNDKSDFMNFLTWQKTNSFPLRGHNKFLFSVTLAYYKCCTIFDLSQLILLCIFYCFLSDLFFGI